MIQSRMLSIAAALGCLVNAVSASAADSAAGQKTFETTCVSCHKLKSYAGKSDTELQAKLQGIVAGTTKHPKKLTLNEADIANVAAYISSNEPT